MNNCNGCQKAYSHFTYYEVNTCTNENLRFCSTCCQNKVTNHQDICFCWKPQERYVFCDLCGIDLSRNRLHVHSRNFGEWHSCLVCSCHSHMPRQPCRCKFPIQESRYSCDTCGDKFLLMGQLQSHNCRQPSGGQFFTCGICQARFDFSENLTSHMRVHTTKTYVCDMCEKTFDEKDHLITHCRTHTGDMSYSCDICGKIFCRRDNFAAHYRIHSGEKPFKCGICQKEFARKNSLYLHVKRHYSEKSYCCIKCTTAFTSKAMLDKHKEIPPGSYGCDTCCKRFNTKKRFDSHLKKHAALYSTEYPTETEIIDLTID